MDCKALAHEVQPFVVAFRRDLHAHPEASMHEFRTTDKIAEELDKLGISYRRLEPTGIIAEIKGGKPGKTVGLRADIDALSIVEKSGVDFASQNDGFMHACGHDTHTAMLMGAAKILSEHKDELKGTVRLIFQPAEEIAEGSRTVIAQHGIDGLDFLYGQHIMAQAPAGLVGWCNGASASAADIFNIKVIGKACHGAMPESGADATVAASAIVMNLQTIVSRELPPTQPVVVTVGKLVSGSRFNIVSGEATMEGTIRSFDVDIHHRLPGIVERIAKETAAAFRCTAEVEYKEMTEVLINDTTGLDFVRSCAEKVVANPDKMLFKMQPLMGAEDFADYTVHVKSAFTMLGGGGEYPQHSDHFCIDENSFETGVAMYADVAYEYLNNADF